jgi:hypothetical protein
VDWYVRFSAQLKSTKQLWQVRECVKLRKEAADAAGVGVVSTLPTGAQILSGLVEYLFATGATEGAHKIATGKLVSFSEQELVDCAGSSGKTGKCSASITYSDITAVDDKSVGGSGGSVVSPGIFECDKTAPCSSLHLRNVKISTKTKWTGTSYGGDESTVTPNPPSEFKPKFARMVY